MRLRTADARRLLDDFDFSVLPISVARIKVNYETGSIEIILSFPHGRGFEICLNDEESIDRFWDSMFPIGDSDATFVRRGRVLYYNGYLVKEIMEDSVLVNEFITLNN